MLEKAIKQIVHVRIQIVTVVVSSTNVRTLPVGRVLRDPAVLEAFTIAPLFACPCLGLPRPLDPSRTTLVRRHLRLPELAQERLVLAAEAARGARES